MNSKSDEELYHSYNWMAKLQVVGNLRFPEQYKEFDLLCKKANKSPNIFSLFLYIDACVSEHIRDYLEKSNDILESSFRKV
jgi:nucleoside-specific outer membrane channel protein Tsx